MRENKYRGRRLDNGEWEHGDLVQFGQQCYTPCKCAIIPGTASGSDPLCKILFDYEVDPATVGQYTGLKDKNGKEICEGDIIQYKSYTANIRWWRTTDEIPEIKKEVQRQRDEYMTTRGVCKYSDGYFSVDGIFLFYVKAGERLRTYTSNSRDVEERQWDFEVVGNIYDNPELLKAE